MFQHNFIYSLKTLFRNKPLIFWTFAFPIIMATFFYMTFSNITTDEKMQPFAIAVVEDVNLENHPFVKNTFKVLSDKKSAQYLFDVSYCSLEKASFMLEKKEIVGYLTIENDEYRVVVKKSGLDETVFQSIVKELQKNEQIVDDMVAFKVREQNAIGETKIDYQQLYLESIASIYQEKVSLIKDTTTTNIDYVMIEYYTLIAMTCLYGAVLGMTAISNLLATMTKKGLRISVSPANKGLLILSSALAAFVVQLIGMTLLMLFTIFVMHVDYGQHIGLMLLLFFLGCVAGLSLGIFVGVAIKKDENFKIGILIAFTMLGCFLAGMMGISMKYTIDTQIPIINYLNPANMITDGFYALYYYSTFERYWGNIISLVLFSILLFGLSIVFLRRQKNASI